MPVRLADRLYDSVVTTGTNDTSQTFVFTPPLNRSFRVSLAWGHPTGDVMSTLLIEMTANAFTGAMSIGRAIELFNTTVSGVGGSNSPAFNRVSDFTDICCDLSFVKAAVSGWCCLYSASGYDANGNVANTYRAGSIWMEPAFDPVEQITFTVSGSGQTIPNAWRGYVSAI